MGTPSDAWREMNEAAFEAAAAKRRESLGKANAARAKSKAMREEKEQTTRRCIHPADDPWTRTCRTLCGEVRPCSYVLTPRASVLSTSTWQHLGCARCEATLRAWKLFNPKPLTYRRLNSWPIPAQEATVEPGEDKPLTPRARAIMRAIEVRRKELGEAHLSDIARGFGGEDVQLNALRELVMLELAEIEGTPSAHAGAMRKAWSVGLMESKPSKDVLAALLRTTAPSDFQR